MLSSGALVVPGTSPSGRVFIADVEAEQSVFSHVDGFIEGDGYVDSFGGELGQVDHWL